MQDQDQLTAAVVAGIVILSSCIGMTLSFFGYCFRRRPDLYNDNDDQEYNVLGIIN
jgi:hypothetical protein